MRYELPRNNQPHFFKYTTAETAKKIVSTQSFRWSSPLNFNDPFDHQTGVYFPFTGQELAAELLRQIECIVFGDAPYKPVCPGRYPTILRLLRESRMRIPKEEILAQLHKSALEVSDQFPVYQQKFNQEMTRELTHSRVLCLTENETNVVMWSHYADQHRGVVFKLRRLEALDHHFLVARKVRYTATPVTYFQLKDFVDNLCGLTDHDPAPIIFDIAYQKHPDWSYENEWRVHRPLLNQPAGDGFEVIPEPKDLFEAVYLGCRMELEDAEAMVRLVREHLPNASIFQAFKENTKTALTFKGV